MGLIAGMMVLVKLSTCLGLALGAQDNPIQIVATGGQAVKGATWSPDGRSFAAGAFKRVAVWNSDTLESQMNATGNTDIVNAVAFSPDGSMLVSSGGRILHGWDAQSGDQVQSFRGHTDYTYAIAFAEDRLFSAGDKTVRVWDVASGKELFNTDNCPRSCVFPPGVYSVAVDAGANLYASGGADGSVVVRSTVDGALKCDFYDHTDMVLALAFNGETLASAAFDGTVRVVNVSSGETLQALSVGGALWTLAYSIDGMHLAASGSDGTVHIWDTVSWAVVSSLKGPGGEVKSLAFDPNGERLLVSQSNMVLLWNLTVPVPLVV